MVSLANFISFQLNKSYQYLGSISFCGISYKHSDEILKSEIKIFGWRFTDHIGTSKILKKDAVSMLNSRECNSQRPKQESYQRFSFAVATSNGEYEDCNSIMNTVSFIDLFLLTFI